MFCIPIPAQSGIPSMFELWGFDPSESSERPGDIPFPGDEETAMWGHAVMAAGYDDKRIIRNTKYNLKTKGAFRISNSLRSGWGEEGYGWLPYDYVRYELAMDFVMIQGYLPKRKSRRVFGCSWHLCSTILNYL